MAEIRRGRPVTDRPVDASPDTDEPLDEFGNSGAGEPLDEFASSAPADGSRVTDSKGYPLEHDTLRKTVAQITPSYLAKNGVGLAHTLKEVLENSIKDIPPGRTTGLRSALGFETRRSILQEKLDVVNQFLRYAALDPSEAAQPTHDYLKFMVDAFDASTLSALPIEALKSLKTELEGLKNGISPGWTTGIRGALGMTTRQGMLQAKINEVGAEIAKRGG